MYEETSRLSLIPTEVVMKRVIHKLMAKDPADIFAEPVSIEDVSCMYIMLHVHHADN